MEGRLESKIDLTNSKVEKALSLVEETNTALEDLEMRVAATETALEIRLQEVEARLQEKITGQVKSMVLGQLREAGFDPDLTAGALTTLQTTAPMPENTCQGTSYAAVADRERPSLNGTAAQRQAD